jgi:inner membrane protein
LDTGTHLVFGLGLAGLAYIDPVVASNPEVATAVLIGTIIGQQAPDFDGIMRFKGSAAYIKNHRGLSHSIPAIAIWTVLITLTLQLIFSGLPLLHVGFWVFTSVVVHVLSDMFNAYGTQAFRPFTKRWISWNIIHIFDPVIFTTHIIAILIWSTKLAEPAVIFPTLYTLVVIYYAIRSIQHYHWEHRMPSIDKTFVEGEQYMLIPTIHIKKWNVLKRKLDNSYVLGELRSGWLHWVDKARCDDHPAIEASKTHPDIKAFLNFTSFVCAEVKHHKWGYEVRWADVRYRHRKNYPFVAVLLLDHNYQPLDSYVGWMNEVRVEKKLNLNSFY